MKITGKVKRNRTFELKKDRNAGRPGAFAGGFSGDIYGQCHREQESREAVTALFTVDNDMMPSFAMMDKDSVSVDSVIGNTIIV